MPSDTPLPPPVDGTHTELGADRAAFAHAAVKAVLLPRTWPKRTVLAACIALIAADLTIVTPWLPWWAALAPAIAILTAIIFAASLTWGRPHARTRWYVHPSRTVALAVRASDRERCWTIAHHVKTCDAAPAGEMRRTVLLALAPIAQQEGIRLRLRATAPRLREVYAADFRAAGLELDELTPDWLSRFIGMSMVCDPAVVP